jgi:hypothetical protein
MSKRIYTYDDFKINTNSIYFSSLVVLAVVGVIGAVVGSVAVLVVASE